MARGDKPYLRKSTDRKEQIRKAFVQFSGLICALRSVDFLRLGLSPRATSCTISFSISNSFWYYYRKRGSASYIVREWLLWEGERERERETPVTSFDITLKSRVIMHMVFRYYRKRGSASYIVREVLSVRERERYRERIIGSAEALPILCVRYFRWEREIQREKDGSDVTIFALKLAMNLHFPLPKIRIIGDELTLSLAKISHFSFLPSRGSHHCGAEIRNEFTLSIAKNFFALFVPPLSNGTSRATSDRKPKTNDQILPSSVLFFSSKKMNQINTKNYWKKKKRLCVRWLGVINLTWENLQIAKHKSGRRSFSLADWFVLCDL